MNNRFEHLKKKGTSTPVSREEFINAADPVDEQKEKPKRTFKKEILLSGSGRINREKNCGKPFLVYIKKDIEHDMKKYCHGSKALIINYLLRQGLNKLIEENKLILHFEDENE